MRGEDKEIVGAGVVVVGAAGVVVVGAAGVGLRVGGTEVRE